MTDEDETSADHQAICMAAVVMTGACFCNVVNIRVSAAPVEMGYCHCNSCRIYSGAPFVTYALFAEDQVTVSHGAELLGLFNKTGISARRFCTRWGCHVMTEHPGTGFIDIHAPVLQELHFRPVWHLNYAEAVLPVRDGLPKLKDFPANIGGSGQTLAE
ncbi:GFA family protein [Roseovarius arcticus]|uniref:GFA family protein n=1 Tax=Roseovarius arcticus TaxID=2547404 RepID=UPI001BB1DB3A|nr:GFA family protein [Roseovarius arcticus]